VSKIAPMLSKVRNDRDRFLQGVWSNRLCATFSEIRPVFVFCNFC